MTKRILVLTAAVLLLAVSARADEWEKKFDVTSAPQLTFRTGDGHIRVDTWDQKQISARIVTEGWRIAEGTGYPPSQNEVRVEATRSGDAVTIDLREPRNNWRFHIGRHWRIEIEIHLPRTADATLRTSDGHVSVSGLTGKLDVETSDGHITLTDVHGDLRLRSSDGHIEGTSLDGKLDAGTSDGRIRVSGRFDGLELRTSDGSVEASVLAGSHPSAAWSLRTSDGNVELRIPGNLDADLDAETDDGNISSDFPITVSGKIGRSSLHGKLNAGGPTIRLRTSDGHIRVSRL